MAETVDLLRAATINLFLFARQMLGDSRRRAVFLRSCITSSNYLLLKDIDATFRLAHGSFLFLTTCHDCLHTFYVVTLWFSLSIVIQYNLLTEFH